MTQSFPWESSTQSVGCDAYGYSGQFSFVGLRPDVWMRAMQSFRQHRHNPAVRNTGTVTVVDFRLDTAAIRLWVVDTRTKDVLLKAKVSHGSASGTIRGPGETFSNIYESHQSSIGGFVTLNERPSSAGGLRQGRALVVRGLDATNSIAEQRHILFHGAVYMANGRVGRSSGCFATEPTVNGHIIDLIKDGSFVFSYGGDVCR